jgi:hypothetical protein
MKTPISSRIPGQLLEDDSLSGIGSEDISTRFREWLMVTNLPQYAVGINLSPL